ncbi:uncharacterized protein LOC142612501 [Castanea sativa]|uniref:uncharacterized protein LOC142612501 n=1 Tax=Castanea sativa TaxID=21020 RepID=UPI003F653058
MANDEWISSFPATKVVHLECGTLDQKPIVIHLEGILVRHQKPWHFEQVWLGEEGCHETVSWLTIAVNGGGLDIVYRLKDEIRTLLAQEVKLWQQQSRIAWLKYGDKNSCYFHIRALQRFRHNQIKALKNIDGV